MTTIDVNERCRHLGITREDYYEAVRLLDRLSYKRMQEGDTSIDAYLDDIKSLPMRSMVAIIRYNGLYKQYPKVFGFDGPIPGVEPPYPYAGREDRSEKDDLPGETF